jgi:hypothetical protein
VYQATGFRGHARSDIVCIVCNA